MVVAAGPALACPIPVFRYALERGTTDSYSLSVIYSGNLSTEARTLLARLNQPGVPAVELKDLSAPGPESISEGGVVPPTVPPVMPWLVLRYQRATNAEPQVTWEGPLDRAAVEQLVSAPDRAEIARRLLAGDSAVWLVLPGTNDAENAVVTQRLQRVLTAAEKQRALPVDEITSSSSIPITLRFSTLTIPPGAPGSDLLRKMLLPLAPEFESLRSPAVVPVYGRGHALTVIAGRDLTEAHLRTTCEFLAGSCSCIYRARNPGVDLFFALDWQSKVVDRPEAVERPRRPGFPAPPAPKPIESGKQMH